MQKLLRRMSLPGGPARLRPTLRERRRPELVRDEVSGTRRVPRRRRLCPGALHLCLSRGAARGWLFTTSSGNARFSIRSDCSETAACVTLTTLSTTQFEAALSAGVTYYVYAFDYTNADFTFSVQ